MEQKKFNTRIVVGDRFALIPIEEIHPSKLPIFGGAKLKVLASPGLGANFVAYLVDLRKDEGTPGLLGDENLEYFIYPFEGKTSVDVETQSYSLSNGNYLYIPPGTKFSIRNYDERNSRILMFKLRYIALDSRRPELFYGNESKAPEELEVYNNLITWKILLPRDLAYDIAFNIATVPPGVGFDVAETHFEEHGIYFLGGQGLYLLGTAWIPYREGDFVYFGPYAQQSVYATGSKETRYLASKNQNRDPPL